jgi:glucokinase
MTGAGLALLHRFLTGEAVTPRDVVGLLSDESRTVAWFARFYGRVARDFALETLALGGLYVAGGVAARTPALVTHPGFAREFRSSPAHGDLLARIPVRLIADDASGLWGAARRALMEALPA